jgi:hypothetical protein
MGVRVFIRAVWPGAVKLSVPSQAITRVCEGVAARRAATDASPSSVGALEVMGYEYTVYTHRFLVMRTDGCAASNRVFPADVRRQRKLDRCAHVYKVAAGTHLMLTLFVAEECP